MSSQDPPDPATLGGNGDKLPEDNQTNQLRINPDDDDVSPMSADDGEIKISGDMFDTSLDNHTSMEERDNSADARDSIMSGGAAAASAAIGVSSKDTIGRPSRLLSKDDQDLSKTPRSSEIKSSGSEGIKDFQGKGGIVLPLIKSVWADIPFSDDENHISSEEAKGVDGNSRFFVMSLEGIFSVALLFKR